MRNYFLDYYKIILAIFVVGIHTSPLTEYSKPLSFLFNCGLFRIAVPTFFLINGYYSVTALSTKQALKKYLARILVLYLFWTALYFPLFVYTHDFSFKNCMWGLLVLLYGYGHFWYLTALFGGIFLLYYLKNRFSKKVILIAAGVLYFIGCFIEILQGYLSTLHPSFFTEIFELQIWKLNFLFFGFPFIAIGYYLKKDAHQFNKSCYLWIVLFLFIVELLVSYFYLIHGRNMLFSLIVVAPLVLLRLMSIKINSSTIYKIESKKYFEKLPNCIYYIHGLPNFFISILFLNYSTSLKFILVALISVLLGVLLIKLNDKANHTFKDKII